MTLTDWNNITNYMDSVGTTLKTFTFNKTQNFVKVTTRGNASVNYTIGSQSGTLSSGQSVSVSENITSFTLTATSGTQTIEVWATEAGTEKEETGFDVVKQLAEKAQLGTVKQSHLYARALEDLALVPRNSLTRAKAAIVSGSLKVAYWGDSITEGTYDVSDLNDVYTKMIERKLQQSLPGTTITVQNFSLGSRKIDQADDVNYKGLASEPSDVTTGFYRSWSTVGKAWRDHVKDFVPDLLIIAFGMNDSTTLLLGRDSNEATHLQSLINFANTWTTPPSIAVVPTIIPTADTTKYTQSNLVTRAVARATREVGKNLGLYVADVNRLYQILRDGKDDVNRSSYAEQNWSGFTTGSWTGDIAGFQAPSGVFLSPTSGASNKMIVRAKPIHNGSVEMKVNFAQNSQNAWINYRRDSAYGGFSLLIHKDAVDNYVALYKQPDPAQAAVSIGSVHSLTINTGTYYNFKVDFDGSTHTIYMGPSGGTLSQILQVTNVYDCLHEGNVEIGSKDTLVPNFAALTINWRDPVITTPTYTEDDLLGVFNDSVQSGNGMNHPSGFGHSVFYYPAFIGMIRELTRA
jgi:lysophospholipase L1-like esterase